MHSLQQKMIERIAIGLKHKSIHLPSQWSEMYREMNEGRWSFKRYPWLREMHDSKSIYNVGQKSAQMGFTETLLNLTFFCIDILGKDTLYVLPNKNPDAGDFSTGRFDPALELSPYLRGLFSSVDNIGHKRAGAANLYIRGSQSRAGLKSLPVSRLLMDEVAEFVEKNIPLAFERTSGQLDKLIWLVSTPTLPGFGISKYYDLTDKKLFRFKCPGCSKLIDLKFPESMIHIDVPDQAQLICHECKIVLDHKSKADFLKDGFWESTVTPVVDGWAGFSINQLYSTTVTPRTISEAYINSQANEADEVEFYNSKLGVTHETKGARVQEQDMIEAISNGPKHKNGQAADDGIYTLGVDVGKVLHYEINKIIIDTSEGSYFDINNKTKVVVAEYGKTPNITDIDTLFKRYNIVSCIIDANPERRLALDFARRHQGRVRLCFFTEGVTGRTITYTQAHSADEPFINVDRSSWLDMALGRYRHKTIYLPIDTNIEYRQQVKEPVKTYKKDTKGNPRAIYLTGSNKDDHYAFARCYAEIAQAFIGSALARTEDITDDI